MNNQELVRKELLEAIEKLQKKQELGQGEWKHCGTAFKTTEEFVEHWKKCPNVPNWMKYTDYPCSKCYLTSHINFNGKRIYQHKCSGKAEKEKPRRMQETEEFFEEAEKIQATQKRIAIVAGVILGIVLIAIISYWIWKKVKK